MKIVTSQFGQFNGRDVSRFMLMNAKGNSVSIINYGASVISWQITDHKKALRDIVLGFDDLQSYLKNDVYMGSVVGRFANRIANGTFSINGIKYKLACNNGINHLHGGEVGFDKVFWESETINGSDPCLSFSYISMDREEGYPGNLSVRVEYRYSDSDELVIRYFAETDKATPVNLTSHCYFNLTGNAGVSILDHSLQIDADFYTPPDRQQIPLGILCTVKNTAFDFTKLQKISYNLKLTENGFDHNYCLRKKENEMSLAAVLADPEKHLLLFVFTTEPGMQFYSGNFLNGSLNNRDGKTISKHAALCLETQHFPDSPNQAAFPSTILLPGHLFTSETIYQIIVN